MQDLTFVIGPDTAAAEIWETLGEASISIHASCTFPSLTGRIVRVVLDDADIDAGRKALLDAGFGAIDRHEVLIAEIDSRPGQLGALARKVADAGAMLTTLYMAMGDRVVIGADDLDKVRALLATD